MSVRALAHVLALIGLAVGVGSCGKSAPPGSAATTYYRNCDHAREAGVTPIRRGDPGYAEHLDADDDGVACEPYRGR